MRRYYQIMTEVMSLNYNQAATCVCSEDFGFDPYAVDDLCDLCRTRMIKERRKVNRRLRLNQTRRHRDGGPAAT